MLSLVLLFVFKNIEYVGCCPSFFVWLLFATVATSATAAIIIIPYLPSDFFLLQISGYFFLFQKDVLKCCFLRVSTNCL